MAKSEKIDVHNKGSRTYTSPSGVEISSGQTVQLDKDEGESMMASYPRELISPDSLRSSPSAQSNKDQHDEIVKLQKKVDSLESGAVTDPKGVKRIEELETALKTALSTNAELAQKYDGLSKAYEDLTKTLEDAKAMTKEAYKQVDELRAMVPGKPAA